jgi:hypothetical protein
MHKQKKPHYHWMPLCGEAVLKGVTVHATVCASCVSPQNVIDWSQFESQRALTDVRYAVKNGYNAVLPEDLKAGLEKLYISQQENLSWL